MLTNPTTGVMSKSLKKSSAIFQKQVPEDYINSLVGQLQLLGYVLIEGDKVTYALPLQPLAQVINAVDQ